MMLPLVHNRQLLPLLAAKRGGVFDGGLDQADRADIGNGLEANAHFWTVYGRASCIGQAIFILTRNAFLGAEPDFRKNPSEKFWAMKSSNFCASGVPAGIFNACVNVFACSRRKMTMLHLLRMLSPAGTPPKNIGRDAGRRTNPASDASATLQRTDPAANRRVRAGGGAFDPDQIFLESLAVSSGSHYRICFWRLRRRKLRTRRFAIAAVGLLHGGVKHALAACQMSGPVPSRE